MKPDIHPVNLDAHVTCACGAAFDTKSTRGSFAVDICSACHPFFTGKSRIVDTQGRVERFKNKYGKKK
jgi:large subunit ribosomal protein L31